MIITTENLRTARRPRYMPFATTRLSEQRLARPNLRLNLMIDENYQIWTATGQNLVFESPSTLLSFLENPANQSLITFHPDQSITIKQTVEEPPLLVKGQLLIWTQTYQLEISAYIVEWVAYYFKFDLFQYLGVEFQKREE